MYLQLFVGALCLAFICHALLSVLSSSAIILARKRELVVLLECLVTVGVLWLFLAVSLGWSAVCDCGIS